MPNYDFSCFSDHIFEVYLAPQRLKTIRLDDLQLPCPECGAPARWKPSARVQPEFKPHWNEHIANHPVYVESREHYRQLLAATDSYGPYLEPGSPAARSMIEQHEERRAKERANAQPDDHGA